MEISELISIAVFATVLVVVLLLVLMYKFPESTVKLYNNVVDFFSGIFVFMFNRNYSKAH